MTTPPATDARSLDRVPGPTAYAVALVLLGVAWVGLHHTALLLVGGDEPLYLLDAREWLAGRRLYSDIFLAHPPLRIWQAAAVGAVGLPLAWARLWSIAATLGTAALLAETGRTLGNRATGLLAATGYLFSGTVLAQGALFIGVEQACLAIAAATWLAVHRRWLMSGLVLALGAQWALHVALLWPLLLLWALRDGGARRLVAGTALGLAPLVGEWLWFGEPMLQQTLAYHVRKVTHMGAQRGATRGGLFFEREAGLLVVVLVGLVPRGSPSRRWTVGALAALGVVLALPRLQGYYFLLPMPWLALAAALALTQESVRRPLRWLAAVPLLLLVLVHLGDTWTAQTSRTITDVKLRQLAAKVLELAPHGPIWGDGALTPALALHTGLPVALGDTDTNAQRFGAGVLEPGPHVDAVLATGALIVVASGHGIANVQAVSQRLVAGTVAVARFDMPEFTGALLQPVGQPPSPKP